jgi:hypothetical protein
LFERISGHRGHELYVTYQAEGIKAYTFCETFFLIAYHRDNHLSYIRLNYKTR